jgi:hypothetical protein
LSAASNRFAVTDDSPWPAEAAGGPWLADGEGGWPEMLIDANIAADRAAMTDLSGCFMARIVYTHDQWAYWLSVDVGADL